MRKQAAGQRVSTRLVRWVLGLRGVFCGATRVLGAFLVPLLERRRSPQEWSSRHRSLLPLQVGSSCTVWRLKGLEWKAVVLDAELVQDAWFFCAVCAINWLGGYGAFPTSPCPVRKAGGSCEVERLLRSEVHSFVLRDADFCGKLLPSDVMHEVDAAVLNYSGEEVLPMKFCR